MLKLDNTLLEELGLGSLPEDQKRQMLQHIYETLELRVGTQLANQMTDKQLEEFEKFIDAGGDTNQAQALQWLETNLPNYKQVVQQTFDSLKVEVRSMAPQLLAAAQQAQGPQEAQIVTTPAPQQTPQPQQAQAMSPQPMTATAQPYTATSTATPQQQVYGQSFQATQPSYGAAPAPMSQTTTPPQSPTESMQSPLPPVANDAAPVQSWQTQTTNPVNNLQPATPTTFDQPAPVNTPMPMAAPEPFTQQPASVIPPASTSSFVPQTNNVADSGASFGGFGSGGQQSSTPAPAVSTWGQDPSPNPTVPPAPVWQQPQQTQPQSPQTPTWQPRSPFGNDNSQPQPPQAA